MKVLLDEHLSPAIAEILRGRGLDGDAVATREDIAERSDDAVMQTAAAEERAVVTNNVQDFRPIAATRLAQGAGHAGLILLPAARSRSRAATGKLADAIETVMRAHPDGIKDSERWIAPPTLAQ